MSNITEELIFQDYNQIIDIVMNNIMLAEQNNNFATKNSKIKYDFNLSKEKCEFNFNDDYIPSKSINNQRIKLDNNIFNNNNICDDFFSRKKINKNNNETEGCKLCLQINKLNVEHKKYLIDYLNKLNESILKE